MKKLMFLSSICLSLGIFAQTNYQTKQQQVSGPKRTAKKPSSTKKSNAVYPVLKPGIKNVVYQYLDTTFPGADNHFPVTGNAGIGTNTPQSALEIKRLAQDGRYKNFMLQLSNTYTANGLNELITDN